MGADEDWVEDVVDGADDDGSPNAEQSGLSPVSAESEVDRDGAPDEEGAEGGNHGARGEGEGPEDDSGDSEDPEGQSGEKALDYGDCEPAERGGEDGIADSGDEFLGLVVAKGKDGT